MVQHNDGNAQTDDRNGREEGVSSTQFLVLARSTCQFHVKGVDPQTRTHGENEDEGKLHVSNQTLVHYRLPQRYYLMTNMLKKILCLLCFVHAWHHVSSKKALVSLYADYGVSAGGTYLWAYPGKMRVRGSWTRVFPVAVHTSMVKRYKYDVLQLRYKKRSIHVHVVDQCAAGDCSKNNRKAKKQGGILLDLHQSGMKRLRLPRWTLYTMRFTKVGTVRRQRIPSGLLSRDGKKNYVPALWK